ncbi:MAG: hypothetical protein KFF68_17215 [Desulfosarcina sp.]|nr:hypothetical protein [Desulfosarcina sp.]
MLDDRSKTNLWFCKNLGDAMLAFTGIDRVEAAFRSAYADADCPDDTAVFLRHESGRLHCEAKVYFSPGSAHIAQILGAEPCEQPANDGLGLLVGHPAAWSVLFPEDD